MANTWVEFEKLISKDRRTIGQVQSTDPATGRVGVTQIGDLTTIFVESNGSAYVNGSYVFIEGGIITGQAPDFRTIVTELLS